MENTIQLKQLSTMEEVIFLDQQFSKHYRWHKPGDYYKRCLAENQEGSRVTLLAYYEDDLAGCCHLLYNSKYPYFFNDKIPEINDLNVFPQHRRKKVASRLFDELESIAAKTSRYVGLGVGLYKDYGNAQRMYGQRGYVMDGNGLTYENNEVKPGEFVKVDDDLIIYLTKKLY